MIPFIDANIWLYLADSRSHFHKQVSQNMKEYLVDSNRYATSWQIVYEFIRCATDPRFFNTPATWDAAYQFIHQVIASPRNHLLIESGGHGEALGHVLKQAHFLRGRFIHDCHIAALMYEHGLTRIITADQDFRRFPEFEVIDPTQPQN